MVTEVSNTNITFHQIFKSICFSKQRQCRSAGSDISYRGLCCVQADIPSSNQNFVSYKSGAVTAQIYKHLSFKAPTNMATFLYVSPPLESF